MQFNSDRRAELGGVSRAFRVIRRDRHRVLKIFIFTCIPRMFLEQGTVGKHSKCSKHAGCSNPSLLSTTHHATPEKLWMSCALSGVCGRASCRRATGCEMCTTFSQVNVLLGYFRFPIHVVLVTTWIDLHKSLLSLSMLVVAAMLF